MVRMKRNLDSYIKTEDRSYKIEALIAEGGFSCIYKAAEIVGQEYHTVILKEFVCDDYQVSGESWRNFISNEKKNNKIIVDSGFQGALTLDYFVREENSGAVLGVTAKPRMGLTLREYVQRGKAFMLGEKIRLGVGLFWIINNFHRQCSLIHGDITPDNIFVADTGMESELNNCVSLALLDFGSAVPSGLESNRNEWIVCTDGYTHPDICSGERDYVTVEDDWYSALACFWFILTGNSPDEYQITEGAIEAACKKNASVYDYYNYENAKVMVGMSAGKIDGIIKLMKELFSMMKNASERILPIINGIWGIAEDFGINKERLYKNLKEEYLNMREKRFADLNILRKILPGVGFETSHGRTQYVSSYSQETAPLQEVFVRNQNSLFIIGDGGVGKTTSLIDLLDSEYRKESNAKNNPLVYIELCVLSQNYQDWYSVEIGGTFIEQFMASYLQGIPRCFVQKHHPYVNVMREELYREPESGLKQYTILLDGLNEVGFLNAKSRACFFETLNHYLQYAKNARIIITGRNEAYEISDEYLQRYRIAGLDDENVEEILGDALKQGKLRIDEYERLREQRKDIASNEYRLWNCLKIPLFLIMYCMVSEKHGITRRGEILKKFFHDKKETLDGRILYGEKAQSAEKYLEKHYGEDNQLSMDLSLRIILDFIIPEIAVAMVTNGHFYLEADEMRRVIRQVLDKYAAKDTMKWGQWYYGYTINVCDVFKAISESDGGEQIPYYACQVLGVTRMTMDGVAFFTHQYFRDYFAACAIINRMLEVEEKRENTQNHVKAQDDVFADSVYPLHHRNLSAYICALIGEILGEHRNMPFFDKQKKQWMIPKMYTQEQKLIVRFLDHYRYIWKERESDFTKASVGLKNLIEVLKKSRVQNSGRADLTGLRLDGLDLSGISLYGVVMSRFNPRSNEKLTAGFKDSRNVMSALTWNEGREAVRCIAVHPNDKRFLLENLVTNEINEIDLEQGENIKVTDWIRNPENTFYTTENDIIFVSAESKKVEIQKKKKKSKLQEWIEIDEEEETNDSKEYEKVIVSSFVRKEERIITLREINGKLLSALFSEESNELAVFVKNMNSNIITLDKFAFISGSISHSAGEIKIDKNIWKSTGPDTFMAGYAGKNEYLIGDSDVCPGNIALWNPERESLKTVLYFPEAQKGDSIKSISYGVGQDEIFVIAHKRDMDSGRFVMEKVNIRSEEELEFIKSHRFGDVSAKNDKRLEWLTGNRKLIVLSNYQLSLWDMEEQVELWKLQYKVTDYFHGNGMFIANTVGGIYEVDIVSGAASCIFNYDTKSKKVLLGRTNRSSKVIILEGDQILKWIDVKTGTAYRHVVLQKTRNDIKKVFVDDEKEIVAAICGTYVAFWDSISGRHIRTYKVDEPEGMSLIRLDFAEKNSQIQAYYERKDYNTYPLKKYYPVVIWEYENLYSEKAKGKEMEILKEKKEKCNYTFSESGVVKEYFIDSPKKVKELNKRCQKRNEDRLLYWLKRLIELEDIQDYDDGGSEKRKVVWLTEQSEEEPGVKRVFFKGKKVKDVYVDTVYSNEKIIGATDGEVVYSCENDTSFEVIKIAQKNHYEAVEMNILKDRFVEEAFITQNTVVMLTELLDEKRWEILFWNLNEKEVYYYQIQEEALFAGCRIKGGVEKTGNRIREMEDCAEKKMRHSLGTANKYLLRGEFRQKKLNVRFRNLDYKPVLLAVILTIISVNLGVRWGIYEEMGNGYMLQSISRRVLVDFPVIVGIFVICPFFTEWCSRKQRFVLEIAIFISLIASVFILRGVQRALFLQRIIVMLYPLYVSSLEMDVKRGSWSMIHMISMLLMIFMLRSRQNVSETLLVELAVFVFVTWIYLYSRPDGKVEKKKLVIALSSGITLTAIGIGLLLRFSCTFADSWKNFYGLEGYTEEAVWSAIIELTRKVLKNAKMFGATSGIDNIVAAEYYKRCLLNAIIGYYGIIPGAAVLMVFVVMLVLLFRGALKQRVSIDRHICMGCAFLLTIQSAVYLVFSLGIVLLPPYAAPFFGQSVLEGSGWITLAIYMSFYSAHRYR